MTDEQMASLPFPMGELPSGHLIAVQALQACMCHRASDNFRKTGLPTICSGHGSGSPYGTCPNKECLDMPVLLPFCQAL